MIPVYILAAEPTLDPTSSPTTLDPTLSPTMDPTVEAGVESFETVFSGICTRERLLSKDQCRAAAIERGLLFLSENESDWPPGNCWSIHEYKSVN